MSLLYKNIGIKKLFLTKKKSGGRNSSGLTSVQHIGGGSKKKYRFIDFFRLVREIPGKVRKIEYDPNRNCFICLVCYKNSVLSYLICSDDLKIGDILITSLNVVSSNLPNSTLIKNVSVGSFIFNLEFFPNYGSKLLRSAGSFGQVLKKVNEDYVLVRLKSKEIRMFHNNCFISFGVVSNKNYKFEFLYKAGQSRYRGIRPVTRGEAKNPVDHPHGGNTSGGRQPMTPKGNLTRGVRTRMLSKVSNNLILKKRHK